MKVCQALYNPMIEESAALTLSIHLSKESAEKVIADHKAKELQDWKSCYPNKSDEPSSGFGYFERWFVEEIEILP